LILLDALENLRNRCFLIDFFSKPVKAITIKISFSILMFMLTITPEHEKLIQDHLDTGRYANAEEVLAIALQLLTRLDTEHQAWIEETRQQIAIGIAELDRGEGVDGPTVMNQYLQKFQAARKTLPS
jgi:antitoxin ParD1/3/4